MNKTVNIELSGLFFHLDEQAQVKLQTYLVSVQNALGETEGRDEIIVEVEARLAELFQQALASGRQVVSLNDVQEACSQMGNPSDFREDSDAPNEPKFTESNSPREPGIRRFYRDDEKRVVGGVAAGLGHYFTLDPVIIRLVFFLSIFIMGPFSVLGYLIFWIITPKAQTVAEQLSMRGESANLENIKSRIQTEVDHVEKSVREWKFGRRLGSLMQQVVKGIGSLFLSLFRIAGWCFLAIGTFGLLLVATLIFAFLTGIGGIWMGGEYAGPEVQFIRDCSQLILPSGFIPENLGVWAMLLLALPIALLIWLVLRLIFKSKMKKERIAAGLGVGLVFSFIGLVAVISIGIRVGVDFEEEICLSETLDVSNHSHKISFEVTELALETNDVLASRNQILRCNQETAYALNLVAMELEVIPSRHGNPELTIERCSRGMTRNRARLRAQNVTCNVQWRDDGTMEFPTHFTFPKADLYRGQHVRMTLSIPVGDSLYISSESAISLAHMAEFCSQPSAGLYKEGMWLMEEEGLEEILPSTRSH